MTKTERDAGLIRAVGTWALTASLLNIIVGAGIFELPSALAAAMGSYAPLAYLVCAIAVGSVAICFAEGGSRIPSSGGAYGYIEAAFGPLAGYVAGTLLWFSNALACGRISAALADVAVSVLPARFAAAAHAAASIVVAIGGIALVNIGGVSRGARFVDAVTTIKLIPLAIFIIAGADTIHRANYAQTVTPGAEGLGAP